MAYPHSAVMVDAMMETLREHFADLDRALAIEAAVKALNIERRFTNLYQCEVCNYDWRMEWSCACDDRCPACDASTSPFHSEVEGDDDAGA
jgi:rubrerythrin